MPLPSTPQRSESFRSTRPRSMSTIARRTAPSAFGCQILRSMFVVVTFQRHACLYWMHTTRSVSLVICCQHVSVYQIRTIRLYRPDCSRRRLCHMDLPSPTSFTICKTGPWTFCGSSGLRPRLPRRKQLASAPAFHCSSLIVRDRGAGRRQSMLSSAVFQDIMSFGGLFVKRNSSVPNRQHGPLPMTSLSKALTS